MYYLSTLQATSYKLRAGGSCCKNKQRNKGWKKRSKVFKKEKIYNQIDVMRQSKCQADEYIEIEEQEVGDGGSDGRFGVGFWSVLVSN